MRSTRNAALALATAILLAGGAAAAQTASAGEPRTYYDTIDLSTPDSAARAFLAPGPGATTPPRT